MKCHCGADAVLWESSADLYRGRDYGPVWVCAEYPACDSYVGCHPGGHTALGSLANKETRQARNKAHDAFDSMWKTRTIFKNRRHAYTWLRGVMDLNEETGHIAQMEAWQCYELVDFVERKKRQVSLRTQYLQEHKEKKACRQQKIKKD